MGTFLSVVWVLIWLLASGYALVSIAWPLRPFKRRRHAFFGLLGIQAASLVVAAVLATIFPVKGTTAASSEAPRANAPAPAAAPSAQPVDYRAQIMAMDKANVSGVDVIHSFDGDPRRTLVEVTMPIDVSNDADYLFVGSTNSEQIAHQIMQTFPNTFTDYRFLLRASFTDTYGRTSTDQTFELYVTANDLNKVSWDTFIGAQFLNITQVVRRPSGDALAVAYCLVPDNIRRARRFCESMSNGYKQDELDGE